MVVLKYLQQNQTVSLKNGDVAFLQTTYGQVRTGKGRFLLYSSSILCLSGSKWVHLNGINQGNSAV